MKEKWKRIEDNTYSGYGYVRHHCNRCLPSTTFCLVQSLSILLLAASTAKWTDFPSATVYIFCDCPPMNSPSSLPPSVRHSIVNRLCCHTQNFHPRFSQSTNKNPISAGRYYAVYFLSKDEPLGWDIDFRQSWMKGFRRRWIRIWSQAVEI